MNIPQRVIRQRRLYNQWVGNQTLEDFALRYTPQGARRRAASVGNTAWGATSFLACEAIGGSITLTFGFANAIAAIVAASVIMFLVGLPICIAATRNGVDVDLLTRGAGFGYIGSTITSLIYAMFTFILFSIEASIMSAAIVMVLHAPLWLANGVSALVVIPIAARGIRAISRMQMFTQPVWLLLQFGPLIYLGCQGLPDFAAWTQFTGTAGNVGLALLPFGMATSILLSLLPQIGEQVDYLRFLPPARTRDLTWWSTMLLTGPGWVLTGAAKLAVGSFLTYLAVERGVDWGLAAQPATMFRIAYLEVFRSPWVASVLMLIFVVTCQIKINTTNAYAGSIAWSNFFSRLTHAHPGRVVWVVFNVLLALLLMQLGIYRVIQNILGLYADFAVGWMGALAADLVINKGLGLSPPGIEFKRAYLYDINPVGCGAMGLSVFISTMMSFGVFGGTARALAPFAGLVVAFCAAPAIAFATSGRYYLARPREAPRTAVCVVCEALFEGPDMAPCPAYGGPICSLCCSLEPRCRDMCKPHGRISAQVNAATAPLVPARLRGFVGGRVVAFIAALSLFTAIIAALLGLIGYEYAALAPQNAGVIRQTLIVVFVALFILSALAAWLLVLAHESRRAAEGETGQQTNLLLGEIAAHERTDAALQKAKSVADSANTAKSRYIVGVIHEIRSPLNAIFGYAQLLEQGGALRAEDAVRTIRRSAAHLSNLVDGLLDISQIETGALTLHRDHVNLTECLDQMSDMFRLQAAAKGLEFVDERSGNIANFVYTDEKRLRQILINLLSNAIKYTQTGGVTFRVQRLGQITEFSVIDTGHGIRPEDVTKIFEPFERGHLPASNAVAGTGLGLTIARLLTEILGGEITVQSRTGEGSAFRVRLFLSEAAARSGSIPARRIMAYAGRRRTILVADDEADHVRLLSDALLPLGFVVLCAADGTAAMMLAEDAAPDLVILDIAMPGMSGLEVASALRARAHAAKILIVSGNLHDARHGGAYDAFLAKPLDLRALMERIGLLLDLDWTFDMPAPLKTGADPATLTRPPRPDIEELCQLTRIGYVRGIEAKLGALRDQSATYAPFCAYVTGLLRAFALAEMLAYLETLQEMQA